MECARFETLLEALLDGALPPAEAALCQEHVAGCPACGELLELAGLAARSIEEKPPVDLAARVLAATSGAVCGSSRERLPARVDGALARTEGEIVDLHLATCDDCRALARVLVELGRDLPTMAELTPDLAFTRDVLAATLPVAARLRRWWRATWPRWVRRPRFAWEAAYVVTLILTLLVTLPGSPAAALPSKALALARSEPPRIAAPASVRQRLVSAVRGVWDPWAERAGRHAERGARAARALGCEADAVARELLSDASDRLGTLLDAAASLSTKADDGPTTTTPDPDAE